MCALDYDRNAGPRGKGGWSCIISR